MQEVQRQQPHLVFRYNKMPISRVSRFQGVCCSHNMWKFWYYNYCRNESYSVSRVSDVAIATYPCSKTSLQAQINMQLPATKREVCSSPMSAFPKLMPIPQFRAALVCSTSLSLWPVVIGASSAISSSSVFCSTGPLSTQREMSVQGCQLSYSGNASPGQQVGKDRNTCPTKQVSLGLLIRMVSPASRAEAGSAGNLLLVLC